MSRPHPHLLFFHALGLIALTFVTGLPELSLALLVLGITLAYIDQLKNLLHTLASIAPFGALFFILSVLFSVSSTGDSSLFSLTIYGWRVFDLFPSTLLVASENVLRLIFIYTLFFALNTVLSRADFLDETARFFPKVALILSISLLLIPRMCRALTDIGLELKIRGYILPQASKESRTDFLTRHSPICYCLTHKALADSWTIAEFLHARGFGSGPRTRPSGQFTIQDILMPTAGGLLALLPLTPIDHNSSASFAILSLMLFSAILSSARKLRRAR